MFRTGLLLSCIALFNVSVVEAKHEPSFRHYWTYSQFAERYGDKQMQADAFSNSVSAKAQSLKKLIHTPVRIAIIYPGQQVSDYWRRSISSFEARLIESRIPYEIRPHFSKPGSQIRLQETQIAAAINDKSDYLIFTLDALQHRTIIERMLATPRPKLILQNITTPLKEWGDTQPFLYVGFDHATGTEILANEYVRRFKGEAQYAIFYGPQGYVSKMRGGTFKKLMAPHEKMKLVAEYYTGFDRTKARAAALQVLQEQPEIKFIFSSSTDIALGVMDAIKELGRQGSVITNGWGGGSSEISALLRNELDISVMRINDDNGVAMAEAIRWDLEGKAVPTIFSGDLRLITKEHTEQEINRLILRAFRYSDTHRSDTTAILRGPK